MLEKSWLTDQQLLGRFRAWSCAASRPFAPPTGFSLVQFSISLRPSLATQGRFLPEWDCYAVQGSLLVCNVGDGSEAEDHS